MPECVRYDEIAGITLQVESDLPITDATFDNKFCDVAHARAAALRAPDPQPPAAP